MVKRVVINLTSVIFLGLISALICQCFIKEPTSRDIHIRSFRYGKDPYVIRCNRGDTLHITFSTDDTGHSFFLEEFDIDVKISPGTDVVAVFKTSDPSSKPLLTKELTFIAKHPGFLNYIVSKSNYRCHVWCGTMHAFEQGKLIILPNTLLIFSIGSLTWILFLWVIRIFRKIDTKGNFANIKSDKKDLLEKNGLLRSIVLSRWTQIIFTILAMLLIYIVVITSIFGTKVSGRNIGVLMMWSIWLFLLVAILTPIAGRIWCTVCPLPIFGEWFQRRSYFSPVKGSTGEYNNKFYGFFLKWPKCLSNNWLKLIVFLIFATFSTTLVAIPRTSGITILMLLLVPTFMALIWEHRAFCRYVCPISAFIGPFSEMSILELRNKSQDVCNQCKSHFCQKGSLSGWACPYGLNLAEMKENIDCGLCLECTRSCLYNNVSMFVRPFGSERITRNMSEAWGTIAIFSIAIIYSVLYLGPWPVVRDYVNIIDKQNWDLFVVYSLIMWSIVLFIMPGILYIFAYTGGRLSKININTKEIFLTYTGSLLPLGLMLWIAFVIPMLFVNVTFIIQSASDPFGWGWDFFGTANIPWHQFLPQYTPWLQAILVLTGMHFSLRNIRHTWESSRVNAKQVLLISLPLSIFITTVAVTMLFFFTN